MGKGKKKDKLGKGGKTIRAKRRASGIDQIEKKVKEGKAHAERGYVHLGVTNTKILTGQEDVAEWSDEELERGQRKDKNGKWQGKRPKVVPTAVHDELVKRRIKSAQVMMREALVPAVVALGQIVQDPDAKDADKVKAISIILDRVMGKTVDKVEVNVEDKPWMKALASSVVSIPEGVALDFSEGEE